MEIGCGPGVAAREICKRVESGYVLAIDRSAKAIQQALIGSKEEIASGRLEYKQVAIEYFELEADQPLFDLVFAVRVGALDGRHPLTGIKAMEKIAQVLKPEGQLFVDGVKVAVTKSNLK